MMKNYQQPFSAILPGWQVPEVAKNNCVIGVLPGEGIGSEVIGCALKVLAVLQQNTPYSFETRRGGLIGLPALEAHGTVLTEETIHFCESIFSEKGAVLCGPAGGRFVYELRRRFNLFCKLTPIQPFAAMSDCGPLTPQARTDVDLVVVRENTNGAYFGDWGIQNSNKSQTAFHRFEYSKPDIARILDIGVRLACARRKKLCVILKPGGIPAISNLWQETLLEATAGKELDTKFLEIDNGVFQLIADASNLDVVVAPNMFGDILSDCGALLLSSRGMSFSGNFSGNGAAIFQTGHGAAHDLAGTDTANPIGQTLSLALMLRESFGLSECSQAIENTISEVIAQGIRTADIKAPGCRIVGTSAMGDIISEQLEKNLTGIAMQS